MLFHIQLVLYVIVSGMWVSIFYSENGNWGSCYKHMLSCQWVRDVWIRNNLSKVSNISMLRGIEGMGLLQITQVLILTSLSMSFQTSRSM